MAVSRDGRRRLAFQSTRRRGNRPHRPRRPHHPILSPGKTPSIPPGIPLRESAACDRRGSRLSFHVGGSALSILAPADAVVLPKRGKSGFLLLFVQAPPRSVAWAGPLGICSSSRHHFAGRPCGPRVPGVRVDADAASAVGHDRQGYLADRTKCAPSSLSATLAEWYSETNAAGLQLCCLPPPGGSDWFWLTTRPIWSSKALVRSAK